MTGAQGNVQYLRIPSSDKPQTLFSLLVNLINKRNP